MMIYLMYIASIEYPIAPVANLYFDGENLKLRYIISVILITWHVITWSNVWQIWYLFYVDPALGSLSVHLYSRFPLAQQK